MTAVQLIVALGALLVAGGLLGTALGGSRLRGRLFRRLFLVALVPTMLVGALTLRLSWQALQLLEAPGLTQPTEAGLDLARRYLDELQKATAHRLDRLVDDPSAAATSEALECAWWRGSRGGDEVWTPQSAATARIPAEVPTPSALPWTGRREVAGGTWVVAARSAKQDGIDGVAFLARRLPDGAVRSLEGVREGSSGLHQLRLYYGSLLRQQGLVVAGGVFLLVVVLALLVSHRLAAGLARPVSELAAAMRRVAEGERSVDFGKPSPDELGDLQGSFAEMTRALDASEGRLRQSERRAAWQQVARRLAHEIKNPLTPIHLAVHRMRKQAADPRILEGLDIIREETSQLERLADEFSTFARLPAPRLQAVGFAAVLRRALQLYAPERRLEGDTLPEEIEVRADEGQLGQLLGNLVKNAVEASPAGAPLHQRWRVEDDRLTYELEDEGTGIVEPTQRIFEPDFTTKSAGTGLGLAICRRIAEDHGASIEVAPAVGSGACLRLVWPLAASEERS
jgi:nitrogen fixation/metabolism regulation signal transduction histidine kinase